MGFGLLAPGLVRLKPALSLLLTKEGAFVDAGADVADLVGLLMGLAAVVEATDGAFDAAGFAATILSPRIAKVSRLT